MATNTVNEASDINEDLLKTLKKDIDTLKNKGIEAKYKLQAVTNAKEETVKEVKERGYEATELDNIIASKEETMSKLYKEIMDIKNNVETEEEF